MTTIRNEVTTSGPRVLIDPRQRAYSELVTDETRVVCEIVFVVIIQGFLGVFGSLTNIINIMVFIKQGLKETVTISFLALCLADLGNVLPLVWASVCSNPLFDIKEKSDNTLFVHLTSGAVCHKFLPYFDTTRNSTVYNVIITQSAECDLFVSGRINVAAKFILFILDIMFTIFMIHRLLVKSKWRSETSAGTAKDGSALRDYRLMKMLAFISFIYISTSIPAIGYTILFIFLDSVINLSMISRNFYSVILGVVVSSEAVCSSFNVFLFYSMSARFKKAFWEIF
ncbi:uncharacterized protein LOC131937844 [Physella acuta]|uniref:uncharacterized protein LOC131937844 n=1 Tax=Physella acuta TaxID=109671 RepID=UPI0027DE662C|nr:uncharacterized protein LOC131937844 [Physella acuta]